MSDIQIVTTEPFVVWKNGPVMLYHGTTLSAARLILREGVNVGNGKKLTDFGRGFYSTTDEFQARRWANRKAEVAGEESALLRIEFDRNALSRLTSLVFVRSSVEARDYWSFVQHCRNGGAHKPESNGSYDVVYGPVAKAWFEYPKYIAWTDYDQISFHTRQAEDMLNNREACSIEVSL